MKRFIEITTTKDSNIILRFYTASARSGHSTQLVIVQEYPARGSLAAQRDGSGAQNGC
jgi:hypothetical protein